MAIVFDCPHCKTNYRLRDEFGGKTATCKNPNCRKIIPVPMPKGPLKQADLDALAAAAFSDEPAQQQVASEMIQVTCSGCDHQWSVEAAKEGKNVLCPECRRPNRVPLRKKQEKADWRTGAGPTMAKKETGLDREGAFGTVGMGGISGDTAREIVKGREAEEEPEERRKKLIKRGVIALVVLLVAGAGVFYFVKTRREVRADANMADAVKELTDATKDKEPRMESVIRRASAEHKVRTSNSDKETADALNDLRLARNKARAAKAAEATDRNGLLAEAALTLTEFLGSTEQVDKGTRMKKDALSTDFRQTFQGITDQDLLGDTIRAMTRKFAADGQPTLAEDFTHQLGNSHDLVAQIGLELFRLDRDKYRSQAEEMLRKAGTDETPSVQSLRLALGKAPPTPKDGKGAALTSPLATAEAAALAGNFDRAGQVGGKAEDRARALATAANAAIDTNQSKAGDLLKAAADLIKGEAKGLVSPFVAARVCRQLTQIGRDDQAESLANALPDEQSKAWAKLGILRARLAASKNKKADDAWLDAVGDPTMVAAAAKAREEVARHNIANGQDYQDTVKSWPPGTVRPFGLAGLVLGKLDADKR